MATTTGHLTWDAEDDATYKVEYKKSSDTEWTLFQDEVTTTSVDIPSLEKATSYDFRVTAECSAGNATGTTHSATTPNPSCPEGYTMSDDGSTCYKVLTEAAIEDSGGSPLTACHFTNNAYGNYGGRLFKINGYNQDGTYTTGNEPTELTADPLWKNASINTTDGRLNICGLWVCGEQTYSTTPVGFSRQFTLSSAKVYYVGMAADNLSQLIVNGTVIIDQDLTALEAQFPGSEQVTFKNWFIYPVQLNAGPNNIQMTATNTSSVGVMGVEIYDATEAQLIACTDATDLEQYIVFTTRDIDDNDDFEVGNWYCADSSYSLVYDPDTDSYSCQKTVYTDPT